MFNDATNNPQLRPVGAPPDVGDLDPRLLWMIKKVNSSEPKIQSWRTKAIEAYRFRDSKQLSDEDEKMLRDQGRPVTAFNTVQKFIRYVSGVQRDSPIALLFQAMDWDNTQAALFGDRVTKYYEWATKEANSDRARAFEDQLVGGMGWTEGFIDRAKDPRGLVGLPRLSPLEMLWDTDCDKTNLGGSGQGCSRWRARESFVETEEAKFLFNSPYAHFLIDNSGADSAPVSTWPSVDKVIYKIPYIQTYPLDQQVGGGKKSKKDKCRIMQFQWWDNEAGYLFEDPLDHSEQWMTEDEFDEYQKQLLTMVGPEGEIENYDRQLGRKWQRAFILNRRHFLEEPEALPGQRFTYNVMCSHWDEDSRLWYGFMRVLMDPQRYANKFFNQMIELYGRQAKGGAVVTVDAFEDKAQETEFLRTYAQPGSVNTVKDLAGFKEKELPQTPASAMALLQFCETSMQNITGISADSMGLGASTQAGVMIKRRQRAGMVLLASEFDSESDFRREEGYIVYDLLKLISDDRLIRVGGPYESELMQLDSTPFSLNYEIELDEVERDPNMKQFLAELIMGPWGQTAMRMGRWLPEFYNVLPIPRKWIESYKQKDKQQQEEGQKLAAMGLPPPGGRGQKKSLPMQMAEVENKKADTGLKQAKAVSLIGKAKADQKGSARDDLRLLLDGMKQLLDQRRQAASGGDMQPMQQGPTDDDAFGLGSQ